jgi:2-dehydro-3-deoxyphosphogluconate aldolase/(4S)-4-hydroxy-2-oxoglutarate aldolase
MRETILRAVREEKLVVILRGVAQEKLIPLAEAMWRGGVRLLEVTYDASGKTLPANWND